MRRSVEATTVHTFKIMGITQRAALTRELGQRNTAQQALEDAMQLSFQASWSRLGDLKIPLAELAQEVSMFDPGASRQLFAKFRRARSVGIDGSTSYADIRYSAHELLAEAMILKNSGDTNPAIELLKKAFMIWDSLNYNWNAASVALELAELGASPRFLEYSREQAAKFPTSTMNLRCRTLSSNQ